MTGESVEQAATVEGWKARARREAAAIIAEAGMFNGDYMRWSAHETMVALVAIGWLQGASYGAHDALTHVDQAFENLRAEL